MAATSWDAALIGAVKGTGLFGGPPGGRVWVDRAPEGTVTFPYALVFPTLNLAGYLRGDGGKLKNDRLSQVSMWETDRDEDPERLRTLVLTLDGAQLEVVGARIHRVSVRDTQRLPDTSNGLVQHALTLATKHDPSVF